MNANRVNKTALLFLLALWALPGGASQVLAVEGQDKPESQTQ